MNLEKAIAITSANPDIEICMPIKYGVGMKIRKAKKPNTAIPQRLLAKYPFLNVGGYEMNGYDFSDMTKTHSKGVPMPEIQDKWLPWSMEEKDLKREGFMLI